MTTSGDGHTVLRQRLARALYASDGGGSWDSHPHTHGRYRRQADALLPVVTAHTDAALAEQRERMVEASSAFLSVMVRAELDQHPDPRCELTADDRPGRCRHKAVAVRLEDGFMDNVCEQHADTAKARGAQVVYAADIVGEVGGSAGRDCAGCPDGPDCREEAP